MGQTITKKTSTKKAEIAAIDLASAVSARVNLKDIYLVRADYFRGKLASGKNLPVQLSHNGTTKINKKQKLINVLMTFSLQVGKTKNNPAISIEADFELIYEISNLAGLKAENFEQFGRLNGVYNAWPYWREFVHDAFARMNLPPLILPSYHIATK